MKLIFFQEPYLYDMDKFHVNKTDMERLEIKYWKEN